MDPNQLPQQPVQPPAPQPAPQPAQPAQQQPYQESPAPVSSGQYDFINSPPVQKKKFSPFGGGGGMASKLKIVLIGLAVFTVVIIIFAMITGGGNGDKDALLAVARKQNQVLNVSQTGTEKAGGNQAQSIAYNTNLTITTDQKSILSALTAGGAEVKTKELAAGVSSKITQELTTAETNGRFDEVFINIVKSELESYQATLKTTFPNIKSKKSQQKLSEANDNVTLLLESIKR